MLSKRFVLYVFKTLSIMDFQWTEHWHTENMCVWGIHQSCQSIMCFERRKSKEFLSQSCKRDLEWMQSRGNWHIPNWRNWQFIQSQLMWSSFNPWFTNIIVTIGSIQQIYYHVSQSVLAKTFTENQPSLLTNPDFTQPKENSAFQ